MDVTATIKGAGTTGNFFTYFRVDASYRDVEQPIPENGSIAPQINDVSAYVDFFPGTQKNADETGLTFIAPNYWTYGDTELALAPITGRTINALLCSIAVGDPTGVGLVANSPWMALPDPLYYHVRYRNFTYGGALQRFSNFAFLAPTDGSPIRLTSPTLTRYPYYGP
jgi:hypothetical protein